MNATDLVGRALIIIVCAFFCNVTGAAARDTGNIVPIVGFVLFTLGSVVMIAEAGYQFARLWMRDWYSGLGLAVSVALVHKRQVGLREYMFASGQKPHADTKWWLRK